jgi:hypothetical protein
MILGSNNFAKILIVNIAMLRKTYYDHGTLMNINKSKKPIVVKHCKEFIFKNDQATFFFFFGGIVRMM